MSNVARAVLVGGVLAMVSSFAAIGARSSVARGRQAYVMLSGWGLYPSLSSQSPVAHALSDIAEAHVAGIVYATLGVAPWIRTSRHVPNSFDPNAYDAKMFAMARKAGATLWLQLRYYDNWVRVDGTGRNLTAPEITSDAASREAFVSSAMAATAAYAKAFPSACTIILGEEETPYHARLGGGLFWAGQKLWDQSRKSHNGEHLALDQMIDKNFVRQYAGVNSILISAIRRKYPSCKIGVHIGHAPLYRMIEGKPDYEVALKSMPRIDFTFYDLYEKVSRDDADFYDKLRSRVTLLKDMGQKVYYLAQLHTTNTFGHGGGRTPSAAEIDKTLAVAESLGVAGMGYYTKNAAPTLCLRASAVGGEDMPRPPRRMRAAECDPVEDADPLDPNRRGQNMVFATSPVRWRYGLDKLSQFLGER